jgi:curved DNA-binding protein CbpA
MDFYEILELKPNASEQDIKKAYYNLSKKYHPDKCKDADATLKFQQLNSAYQILMDDKIREKYLKMDIEEKTNFQKVLEKIFLNKLKIEELKNIGINLTKKDWEYLQHNFSSVMNSINFKELFNLIVNGDIPEKKQNNFVNCSDSEINCWDELQAEYYYDLPINYHKHNKLDIRLSINVTLMEFIEKSKRKIKVKRKFEDEETNTTFIFSLNKPYVIFNQGGDMDDGDYGNLIIQLNLPNNFIWKENLIVFNYPITLYQMVYGLNINVDVGTPVKNDSFNTSGLRNDKKIEYKNWVPSRDGFFINVENINIKNHYFGIKLSLDYEHSDEKEEILKIMFN